MVLVFLCQTGEAQYVRSPAIHTLGVSDGLANKRVSSIVQDSKGFLWVGTWFGLHRYNGYDFETWQHQPGNPNSLSGNLVYWVLEDSQQRIWVGCRSGLNLLDPASGNITRFVHKPDDPHSLSNNEVEHVYEDLQGQIWICTQSGDLNLFVPADSSFLHWRARGSRPGNLRMFLVEDDPRDSNQLWVGADWELYTFDKSTHEFSLCEEVDALGLRSVGLFDLEFEGDSLLWIATWGRGILKFDLRTREVEEMGYFSEAEKAAGKYEVIVNMEPRNQHEFWLTTGEGPAIFNKRTGQYRICTQELAGLGENRNLSTSRALCVDRSGVAWMGGFEGLNKLDDNTHRFLYYPLKAESSALITRFAVNDVVELPGGDLVVSTHDGDGLYFVDAANEAWKTIPLPADTFRNHFPRHDFQDLLLDRNGDLLALHLNGLFRFNQKALRLEPYFMRPDLVATYNQFHPLRFAEDQNGNLWFGSQSRGLLKYDLASDSMHQFQNAPGESNSLLSNGTIWDILPAPNGEIWVVTPAGLSFLNPENGTFRHIQAVAGQAKGLWANNLREMAVDDQGCLWVGSMFGGVFRLDPALGNDQAILNLHQSNGLLHNSVLSLRKDGQGNLWAVSEKGLSVIDPVTLDIRNFGEADGMAFMVTGMNVRPGTSGHMYLGAQSGFLRSHPDSLQPNPFAPLLHLGNFKVNGAHYAKQGDVNDRDTLMLAADENFISFEMAALNFSNSTQNQYAYQLENVDPTWVMAGQRRFVSYPDLKGGWYRLRIRGTNNDGIWSPHEKQLVIHIAYPWYQQWWFLALVGLAAIALLAFILHLRTRQVRREEQIKAEFSQRLQNVEMAALRAQMNPHFLFNCLNCINRYIVRNEPQKASEYLSDFAVLIRMILDHSKEEQIQLDQELKALNLYIQMESLRFEEKFEYSLEVEPIVDLDFVRVPPLILQPFVENAIWHGLMHKQGKGLLKIHIGGSEQQLVCRIEDNGVGRSRAAELKSKSAPLHKSMGMDITASRLGNLSNAEGLRSTIEVVDLFSEGQQPCGTLVILKIPH